MNNNKTSFNKEKLKDIILLCKEIETAEKIQKGNIKEKSGGLSKNLGILLKICNISRRCKEIEFYMERFFEKLYIFLFSIFKINNQISLVHSTLFLKQI